MSKKQFSPEELEMIRKALSFLESSHNEDANHPVVEHGVNAGDSAMGQFGLMPITAKEFANRMLKEQGYKTPPEMMKNPTPQDVLKDQQYMNKRKLLDNIANTPDETLPDYMKSAPEAQDLIVNKLIDHIGKKTGYDPEKVIYNWEKGQNNPNPITPEDLDNSGRVKVFREKFKNKNGN